MDMAGLGGCGSLSDDPAYARDWASRRRLDEDFGPAFIKICAYFPYPVKASVNGHE